MKKNRDQKPMPLYDPSTVKLMLLPVGALLFDWATGDDGRRLGGYQRRLQHPRVTRCAREFKSDLIGVLHISARDDGTFYCVDGQHRVAMLRLIGAPAVNCLVHFGMTRAQEAALFVGLNRESRKTSGVENYLALLASGDEDAAETHRIVLKHGWEISAQNRMGHLRFMNGVKLATKYKNFDKVLALVTLARGYDKVPDTIVGGLAHFLRRHVDVPFSETELIHVLREDSYSALVKEASWALTGKGLGGQGLSVMTADYLDYRLGFESPYTPLVQQHAEHAVPHTVRRIESVTTRVELVAETR